MADQNKKIKSEGFVSIDRSIMRSSIFQNAELFQIYITCIMRASYEDKKIVLSNQIVELKRGQFVIGVEKFGQFFGLNEKKMRARLNALKRANKIATKGANKFTLITVLNYDYWQGEGRAEGRAESKTKGEQRATNNNYNKYNKKNYLIFDFLSDVQKGNFKDKPKWAKYKLSDPKKENRILTGYYFLEGYAFESDVKLNCQLKQDRESLVLVMGDICQAEDKEIFEIMANLKKNGRLSLENTASAINARHSKSSEIKAKTDDFTKELSEKFNMPF